VVRLHGLSVAGTSSRQGHFCSRRFVLAPDDIGNFRAAFLARRIGAILFGDLGDRFGRKRALVTSALLMALAKMAEGLLPTYSTAGHLAPAIFLVARIASGVSLGGEFTGTAVMLFESTQPRRRGLTTSLANIMSRRLPGPAWSGC
jgi:MFS family permease